MSMNTCNSGSWTIPTSSCSRFASMVAIPVPLPFLKPCKAWCRMMGLCSLLFTISMQTFQMTSNNHMPLYPPPPLGISTIVVHDNASGMYLSCNDTLVILTSLSHFSVSGSFSLVASLSHVFRYSAFVTDGYPACIVRSFCTANAISSTSGFLFIILTSFNIFGAVYPYSGRRL